MKGSILNLTFIFIQDSKQLGYTYYAKEYPSCLAEGDTETKAFITMFEYTPTINIEPYIFTL